MKSRVLAFCAWVMVCISYAQLNQEGVVRVPVDSVNKIDRIAFGSCNHQNLPQEMWLNVLESQPDLWIWVGDNIYGNSKTKQGLIKKYNKQLRKPNYLTFLERIPVIGIWDDHDFGTNNCYNNHPLKKESEQLFYEFIGEPAGSVRRQHEGIYHAYEFGRKGREVKIYLLDTRYFREAPGETADMLGEAQWQWLENELMSSKARINFIVTSTQFLSTKKRQESWQKYPRAAGRMYDLVKRSQKPGIIFLSGDIHCAELMKNTDNSLNYTLYEFTSSGLTHASRGPGVNKNSFKVENPYCGINYGLISISWREPVSIKLEVKDIQNFSSQELIIYLDDLNIKSTGD